MAEGAETGPRVAYGGASHPPRPACALPVGLRVRAWGPSRPAAEEGVVTGCFGEVLEHRSACVCARVCLCVCVRVCVALCICSTVVFALSHEKIKRLSALSLSLSLSSAIGVTGCDRRTPTHHTLKQRNSS